MSFGPIFVKSTAVKSFILRNDLRNSIIVQLNFDNIPELRNSFQKAQVIPPSQTAGFEISLRSENLQNFQGFVKYVINYKYSFSLMVTADIEPVKISLSLNTLKFSFPDESIGKFL